MADKKKILVVDDDMDLLLQIKVQLEAAGYDVVTAEGRKDAETQLETLRPDLVVLDLMMEEMDAGFALSYHIKKKDATLPVILMTAVTRETGLHFDDAAGDARSWVKADAVLSKPVRFEQLNREIKRLVG